MSRPTIVSVLDYDLKFIGFILPRDTDKCGHCGAPLNTHLWVSTENGVAQDCNLKSEESAN